MIFGQFVDTYPPNVDGVGRVTQAYCQTLVKKGHEAYYIAPESPVSPEPEELYGVPCILSASVAFPGEQFRMGIPALDYKFRRRVREVPFNLVHAHSPFLAGGEALKVARKREIPLVSTFHSKYYDDALAKTHSKMLADAVTQGIVRFYEKCDAVWTVNNATADVLRSYGYYGNILIMENGTNPEEVTPAGKARLAAKVTFRENVPVLLFVGQHNYKKNIHGILQACRLLKDRGTVFQLVMAGNGPDFEAICQEIRDLGLERDTTVLGFMGDREELMALYSKADLLVFPSIYDNAPMVLREAAVMGTPGLVVKNSCSAEGVKDEYNGFICKDESSEAIANTIIRALPICKRVGEKARETIPVSWDQIIDRVLNEYERLIARHVPNMYD